MKYKKFIGIPVTALIFYFIGIAVLKQWSKISTYNWSPNMVWLVISLIILLIAYLFYAYGWTLILRMIGAKIESLKGMSIFLLSIYGRYLPGGVWSVLGRVYLSRAEYVPDSLSLISIILEQAYTIISAGAVFVLSFILWKDAGTIVKLFPAIFFLLVFIIFLHPKPFFRVVNPILVKLKKKPIDVSFSFKNMLTLALYYSTYWVITGVAFYCFIRAFYKIDLYYILMLIGIYAISFVVGNLVFFIPTGLGVREASLVLLLSLIMPKPLALGLALLSRLWVVGVELIIMMLLFANSDSRKMMKTVLGF